MNFLAQTLKPLRRLLTLSLMVGLFSMFCAAPVMAIPSLPSSFYGEVKINNAYVPDGTVVRALINDQVFAEGLTQTYQGASVYTVDIPGDDGETTALDGGREGDTVQFEIGGVLADQTGTWGSGTNVRLNLTANTTDPTSEPQPTPIPPPTQTAIILPSPLQTLAPSEESSPSPEASAVSSPTLINTKDSSRKPAAITQSSEIITPIIRSSPEPALPLNPEGSGSKNTAPVLTAIIVIILLGSVLFIVRKKIKS